MGKIVQGTTQNVMPHMCRKSEDGTKSQMHTEISRMNCRGPSGSLKGAVLAAEADLREAEADNRRKL